MSAQNNDRTEYKCRECGKEKLTDKPGRIPDYCSNACRQRAFYWRFKHENQGVRYKARVTARQSHE